MLSAWLTMSYIGCTGACRVAWGKSALDDAHGYHDGDHHRFRVMAILLLYLDRAN